MIIVIDGPDGSGKSTLGTLLVKQLNEININAEYKHFEFSRKNLLILKYMYMLMEIFYGKKFSKKKEKVRNIVFKTKKPSLKTKLICSTIIIDKSLSGNVIRLKNRNKTLVIDCWVYDNLVPFLCEGKVSKKFYELLLKIKPLIRGDIEVFLDGDENILYQRRARDYKSIEEVKCHRKYFNECAKKMNSPIIFVNTPANITIKKLIREILKQLPKYSPIIEAFHILSNPFINDEKLFEVNKNIKLDKRDIYKILALAKYYKLTIPVCENLLKLNVNYNIINKILEKEKDITEKKLSEIKRVTESFEKENIDYAVFKSLSLVDIDIGSDLDLLVLEKNKKDIIRLITNLGYTYYGRKLGKLKRKILKKEKYVIFVLNPSKKFYLDLHFIIKWNNFILPSKIFINNKMKNELSINVLKPEYELLLIVAHSFFKHNKIKLRDIYKFYYLYNKSDKEDLIYLINKFNLVEEFSMFFNALLVKNYFLWDMNINQPNIKLPKMNKNWTKIVNSITVPTKILKQLS